MTSIDETLWQRVLDSFDEIVDLPEAEQRIRLSLIGASDARLHDAVRALIESDAQADHRLAGIESAVALLLSSGSVEALSGVPDAIKLAGRTIGHFRVLDQLAVGGMGVVYRAWDAQLNRSVALKFPLPEFRADPVVKERFMREARSAGALDHPNVCSIYEAGETEDGQLFLAMPLYEGETLRSLLSRTGALPIQQALKMAHQIAAGLACAHVAGIIHRDLKPANLMLLPDGTVKILDFGLAKVRDLPITGPLVRLGTASYMAPEHIRGAELDGRADLWALGVVLYEIVTGERPFSGDNDVSVVQAILDRVPTLPSSLRPDVPRSLERLILRLLQKDPAERYDSATDVAADIAAIDRGESPRSRLSLAQRYGRLLAILRRDASLERLLRKNL